jgi:hypothetical protein
MNFLFFSVIVLDKIMDDGLFQRWTYFFMKENEITLIKKNPLVKTFLFVHVPQSM